MKWISGGEKRQCGRALAAPRHRLAMGGTVTSTKRLSDVAARLQCKSLGAAVYDTV
jgi:hypothetical protein